MISALQASDVEPVVVNGQITDYIICGTCGIERKTVADFMASIIDKRIFRQAQDLKKNFQEPLVILEGGGLYTHNQNIRPNVIRGVLLWLNTVARVPVMRTYGVEDSAECISLLARRRLKYRTRFRSSACYAPRKSNNPAVQQARILESIPGIGRQLSERISGELGSVKDVLEGGIDKLSEVPGLGKKKAENIIRVLSGDL